MSVTSADSTFTAEDLIASGNQILTDTPDNEWWQMRPQEVVRFAFPDWDIAAVCENSNYNKPTFSTPRVLLKHRTLPDRWFLIVSPGLELLPGRMSTMGQFFRFNPKRQTFATGTADDILAGTLRRNHPDSRRDLAWWLLDAFADAYPTPSPAYTYDAPTQAPMWAFASTADAYLRAVHEAGTPLNDTRTILRYALPGWDLLDLFERSTTQQGASKALLRHRHDVDRLLVLTSWSESLVGSINNVPALRAGEQRRAHTDFATHTTESFLAEYRAQKQTFPASQDLWWALHQIARTHPDATIAESCRDEMERELFMCSLLSDGPGGADYQTLATCLADLADR